MIASLEPVAMSFVVIESPEIVILESSAPVVEMSFAVTAPDIDMLKSQK